MLVVALFNLGGYGLFMAHVEEQAMQRFEQQLDDDNYNSQHLITFKLPVQNLPYYTNSQEYQRQEGEIEINGVTYNYVKRRIYNDSLEVVCIPNTEVTRLRTARNDFFKRCADLENALKSKKAVAAFKFFSPGNYREKKASAGLLFYNDCTSIQQPCCLLPNFYTRQIENPPEC